MKKRTGGDQGKGPKGKQEVPRFFGRRCMTTIQKQQDKPLSNGINVAGTVNSVGEKQRTEQELLDMKPAKDASPEEWRVWHQMLYDVGLLRPPGPVK